MSASWATFLFEAANFLLLAALLGWIFFRPVRGALERHRAALEAQAREATEKCAEAERQLADAAAQRSAVEASLAALRERAQREAWDESARLLEAARAQAQRERDALKTELAALRRGQARALARDAAAAASEIVVRLLAQIRAPDLESSLLEHARRQLAELAAAGPLEAPIVESAAPLAPEALARLAQAAGVPVDRLAQRTAPELVAGLRIVTPRGLVDASAAGLAVQTERGLLKELDAENADDD